MISSNNDAINQSEIFINLSPMTSLPQIKLIIEDITEANNKYMHTCQESFNGLQSFYVYHR